MDLQSVLTYTTDNWIALLAAAIALLSALYSRWAVKEAKRANRIAVHEHQMKVYVAFQALYDHVTATNQLNGLEADEFAEHATLAAMYFPAGLASRIKTFQQACKHAEEALFAWYKTENNLAILMRPHGPWSPNLDEQRARAREQAAKDEEVFQGWLQKARTHGEDVQVRLRNELSLVR